MIFQSQILFHPVSFSEIFRSEFLLKSENLQRNFPNIYSNYKHKNLKYLIKKNLLYFTAKIYFVNKVNLYSRVKNLTRSLCTRCVLCLPRIFEIITNNSKCAIQNVSRNSEAAMITAANRRGFHSSKIFRVSSPLQCHLLRANVTCIDVASLRTL